MLSYLIDFYDIEYAAWQVVDELGGHDEFDYESYEDEEENDGGSAGPPPPSQPRLTLRDAVQTYPERAVAALEGILGLNEDNFINFRDRARQQASSPRRPVKRQYQVPDRTDERGQPAPAKRVPKPIQGKAERAPLPLVQNRLTLEEVLDGIDEENDKEKSTSTRVMWDDGSGRRRRMQKMQQLAERGARSSEGSPTNADTLSREEARSRRRTPSDPLDLRS
ncbi:hypothetical protein ColTof4_01475 [Colletotrichum tofieldiae]|uniref:Uncharacterized protein n=1 Tax=Colletotrichum tofieldiae TaxID=708197 RepID=A0A166QK60_9PEZI|nr:hypothetical protein CT0861_04159 [Colletotrichum tofieldiae]GKT61392.1 hypothetical protein ColTof3_08731 [Colletotrichum tofieldiae]GKT69052.1 hypothetical protein ColTof4_01475 [Colletotrichum tofieldiae]GKT96918.1 hypothetical protein Ct61P_14768 [Colletotrichum tofieldiae]